MGTLVFLALMAIWAFIGFPAFVLALLIIMAIGFLSPKEEKYPLYIRLS